jgi:hypothetical protein
MKIMCDVEADEYDRSLDWIPMWSFQQWMPPPDIYGTEKATQDAFVEFS